MIPFKPNTKLYQDKSPVTYSNYTYSYMKSLFQDTNGSYQAQTKSNISILSETNSIVYSTPNFFQKWSINNTTNITDLEGLEEFRLISEEIRGILKHDKIAVLTKEEVIPNKQIQTIKYIGKYISISNSSFLLIEYQYVPKSENEREQYKQLQDTFLNLTSHELRTPLNAILGFSDLGKESGSLKKNNEYFEYINKAGNQLFDMVKEILDILRLETITINPNFELFKFQDLMQEVKQQCYNLDIEIELENSDDILFSNYQYVNKFITKFIEYCAKKDPGTNINISFCRNPEDNTISILTNSSVFEFKESNVDSFSRSCFFENSNNGFALELILVKKIICLLGGKIESTFNCYKTNIDFILPTPQEKK